MSHGVVLRVFSKVGLAFASLFAVEGCTIGFGRIFLVNFKVIPLQWRACYVEGRVHIPANTATIFILSAIFVKTKHHVATALHRTEVWDVDILLTLDAIEVRVLVTETTFNE